MLLTYRNRNSLRSISLLVSLSSSFAGTLGSGLTLVPFLRWTLSGVESNIATAGPRHSDAKLMLKRVQEQVNLTEYDKDDVCLPIELAEAFATIVECEVDGSTQDSTTITIC